MGGLNATPGGGPPDAGLSVGEAAARLGVAASTLRTWERRYGLIPSGRSSGGHRRYAAADLQALDRMHELTLAGETPARAALRALGGRADGPAGGSEDESGDRDRDTDGAGRADRAAVAESDSEGQPHRTGPGGRVLSVPGASPEVRGLARAAGQLDVDAAAAIIEAALRERGVVATYDALVRPVLAAAGEAWARTGTGIEVEHLFSEAVVEALRHHRRSQRLRRPGGGAQGGTQTVQASPARPVLLACAPHDYHVIPLHVLAAALAEQSVPSRTLGSRVPPAALAAAVTRTRAVAVFVWAQMPSKGLLEILQAVPVRRPRVRIVVGGPGWSEVELPKHVAAASSLDQAIALLA